MRLSRFLVIVFLLAMVLLAAGFLLLLKPAEEAAAVLLKTPLELALLDYLNSCGALNICGAV